MFVHKFHACLQPGESQICVHYFCLHTDNTYCMSVYMLSLSDI